MKRIKIITQNINIDIASSAQTRKETIINACRSFMKNRVKHVKLARLDAEISIRDEDVLILLQDMHYVCKLEGLGELYIAKKDGVTLQKLDELDKYYEQIKLLEEVILLALHSS